MVRKAYILSFDRDDEIDYKDFHKKLTELPEIINWWHYIKSSYILISSEASATKLNAKIIELFTESEDKSWILIEVNLANRNGKLVKEGWEWLRTQKSTIT